MSQNHSAPKHPRPDFERVSHFWHSLDGEWSFAFDDGNIGLKEGWYQPDKGLPSEIVRKINVPYVFQTSASGINEQQAHQVVWYQTEVSQFTEATSQEPTGGGVWQVSLNFGAVDYEATVWLGGKLLGKHSGGHVPFEFDITGFLHKSQPTQLIVRVWDAATDLTQPRGKQYWASKPEGIFYTPSTGIWQSVWIDYVPEIRILNSSKGTILRSSNIESGELEAEIAVLNGHKAGYSVAIAAELDGVEVVRSDRVEVETEQSVARLKTSLRLTDEQLEKLSADFLRVNSLADNSCWREGLALWSPEHPILYDIYITLHDTDGKVVDVVKTYVGMRSLNWTSGDGSFRINDLPYFQALVLDQGYWPDSNLTPPNSKSCKEDIILSKKMGFNGCRKHQKVEDPAFLYWADKLGYLVWGEMASGYKFSNQYVQRFDQEWMEAVRRDINHPCIVTWTTVNETWGYPALSSSKVEQDHIRSLYYMTKTLDPTRSINDNCGWEHVCTDLTTFHDYSDGPALSEICGSMETILQPKGGRDMFVGGAKHQQGMPVMCTEFGGVSIALQEGEKEVEGSWGYTTASNAKDLLDRLKRLMLGVVEGGHCCGFVYTQL